MVAYFSTPVDMTDISQAGDAGCVLLAPLLHSAHAQQGAALTDVWAGVNDGIDRIEVLSKKTVASPPEDRDGADVAPAPEPKAAPSATKLVPQNRLIYICDEDIKYANELSVQLSSFGYDTECFADPLRLQKAALASPPDVVVMDTMFPASGLSGTDIAARIRLGLAVPPPVVFFSVKNDFQTRLKAVQAGGAAFSLKPIVATTLIDTLDALTRSSETERLRILIMDDEPEAAAYHRMILEQAGMVVRELHHPEHVLEILSEFRPDLILLDLYMRDCSGRDLAGLVRQIPEFISLPIVFLSGETDRVTQVSAQRVGGRRFSHQAHSAERADQRRRSSGRADADIAVADDPRPPHRPVQPRLRHPIPGNHPGRRPARQIPILRRHVRYGSLQVRQ